MTAEEDQKQQEEELALAKVVGSAGAGGPGKHHGPTHEDIAVEAYYEWEDRVRDGGAYFGEAKQDWVAAELVVEKSCGD